MLGVVTQQSRDISEPQPKDLSSVGTVVRIVRMIRSPENFADNIDIHVHVPSGAIPKDGPSAGVTLYTSLVSLLKNQPTRSDIAMTGEVTLRGLVLPVCGIKEKVLAARNAGVKHVILPEKNKKDLEKIPPHVKEDLKFHFVHDMDAVIKFTLDSSSEEKDPGRSYSTNALYIAS
jgi:ATP-dependent Lon protease